MHEKLDTISSSSETSWDQLIPKTSSEHSDTTRTQESEHKGDSSQCSEEELLEDPIKRFHVNRDDFKIFSKQMELDSNNEAYTQGLDYILGRYVKCTADIIASITGEDGIDSGKEKEPYDFVFYLDNSGRPVSWLVDMFWDDFTKKERPPHSFLRVKCKELYSTFGIDDTPGDYDKETGNRITSSTVLMKRDRLAKRDYAQLRALYLPDGIEDEDPDKIMATPSPLDGKRILIVDEISRNGTTVAMAEALIRKAFKDVEVGSATFWDAGRINDENSSTPIWYSNSELGQIMGGNGVEYYSQ